MSDSLTEVDPSLTVTLVTKSLAEPKNEVRNWISDWPELEFVTVAVVLPMLPS